MLKCFADQRQTPGPGPWKLPCDHSYSFYDKKLIFKLRWSIFLLQHNLFLQGEGKGGEDWQHVVAIFAQDLLKIRSTVTAMQISPGLNKTGDEVAEN